MSRSFNYSLAVAAPIALASLLALVAPPPVPRVRELVFDTYHRLQPRRFDAALPVRIVAIDDASLARLGQWPWGRDALAALTRNLARAGAAAIAFDVVFGEPDQTSPDLLVRRLPDSPERQALERSLSGASRSHDQAFADAISEAPVVLGFVASSAGPPPAIKAGIATAGDNPAPFVPSFPGAVSPVEPLVAAASGLGAVNWVPDGDSVIRMVPTLVAAGGGLAPSLAMESLRIAQGASTILVRSSNASGETAFGQQTGINAVRIGDVAIETEPSGQLRLRARRAEPASWISAASVIDGTFQPADVSGRIVFVGAVAIGLGDRRTTPVDESIPGVEVHAQTIEQILTGARLVRPDWMVGMEAGLIVALGAMLAAFLRRMRGSPLAATATALIFPVLVAAGSWLLFSRAGLLMDPVVPTMGVLATMLAATAYHYAEAEQRRASVRGVFGRFVTPAVVERLVEFPDRIVLGGELRPLTIMFSDVRDFTSLSETRSPEEVVSLVRRIHTPTTAAVLRHGGTVDKYIGDGMMAFWNAPLDDPDHAANACLAALEIAAVARDFTDPSIRVGLGLHTGPACVGNLGSEQRLEYSALGDAVNLASRVESLTRRYAVSIIVTDATAALAPGLCFLELDRVRVKGRHGVTTLFALHGTARNDGFEELKAAHAAMLAASRNHDFDGAVAILSGAADLYGARYAGLRRHYEAQLRDLAKNGRQDWDGIHTLDEK
jgi:adenylate cyclase